MTVAVIACGALTKHIQNIAQRNSLEIHIESINPLLHNQPDQIAGEVESALIGMKGKFAKVAVAYADCGTYGELDAVIARHNVNRLSGNHCYDVFATAETMRTEFDAQPGTFVLTDYLIQSFDVSVFRQLGLNKYPELRDDYFGNYQRLLWLAQHPTENLKMRADQIAKQLQLPLEIMNVGEVHLEQQLLQLLSG